MFLIILFSYSLFMGPVVNISIHRLVYSEKKVSVYRELWILFLEKLLILSQALPQQIENWTTSMYFL